jgi:hypothetical protein
VQSPFVSIPKSQREHTDEPFDGAAYAPSLDGPEQDLRVRVAAELRPTRFELRAKLAEVVNLTVEDDDITAVCRRHRLVPERRQIDYREPSMSERNSGNCVYPDGAAAGTAMPQRVGHTHRDGLELGRSTRLSGVEKPYDSAHEV